MNPSARPRRHSRWLSLGAPLMICAGAFAAIILGLTGPIREARFSHACKATLLELQRALQDYHVAEEIYPRRTPMSGAALAAFLLESGHLETPPLNPWTRRPYAPEDPGQPDGIRYATDELAETYALQARHRDLSREGLSWQLDSTEHHSLE